MSDEIKRYYHLRQFNTMKESSVGNYVEYENYARLAEENNNLKEELVAYKTYLYAIQHLSEDAILTAEESFHDTMEELKKQRGVKG